MCYNIQEYKLLPAVCFSGSTDAAEWRYVMSDKNRIEHSKSLEFIISVGVTIIAAVCIVVQFLAGILLQNLILSIILALVCLAGAYFVTNYLAKKLFAPIKKVADRMVTLAENGDLTSPVPVVESENEVGLLSRCLDSAVSSMRECISNMSDGLDNVAQGNLTYELSGEWRGDFAMLKSSYDKIILDLCGMFSEIGTASGQVNTGSMQVADGAQMLSQGATQQADSIKQLSMQIEDVAEKVRASAYAAKNTTGLVKQTTDRIGVCSQEMSDMLTAIEEINNSSHEISKIIKVIDDIAFQTNILALNAAVEAAHAGAAGKGFAVVADEVRNLAAKSAEAASQTTSLIKRSISSVEKGSQIAMNTAAVLEGIVSGANEISREITNITEATEIQEDAIRQINLGVEQISSVVQSNTSTAEESAAASEELSGQSSMLREIISRFRYERDDSYADSYGDDSSSDYDSGSYSSSDYDDSSYSSTDYGSSSYSSSDYDDSSYSSSGYDSSSYSSSSYDDSSYSSSGYDSSSTYTAPSYEPSAPEMPSVPENKELVFDNNDITPTEFTPIQFNHTDYEDAPAKIILDDDDFVNVDSKY